MPAGYGPPRPDLQAPEGLDPGTQAYLEAARRISPHISEAQFMHPSWRNAYDPQGCPQDKPFHSTKQGGDNACVEKPDNCPDGKTAFSLNECVSVDDPRVRGGAGPKQQGQQGGQPATEGQPGDIAYTGNPLVDSLLYQFNNRRSLQTGAPNLFTGFAGAGQEFPNISGQLLKGGGLIWGAPGNIAGAPPTTGPTTPSPTMPGMPGKPTLPPGRGGPGGGGPMPPFMPPGGGKPLVPPRRGGVVPPFFPQGGGLATALMGRF